MDDCCIQYINHINFLAEQVESTWSSTSFGMLPKNKMDLVLNIVLMHTKYDIRCRVHLADITFTSRMSCSPMRSPIYSHTRSHVCHHYYEGVKIFIETMTWFFFKQQLKVFKKLTSTYPICQHKLSLICPVCTQASNKNCKYCLVLGW